MKQLRWTGILLLMGLALALVGCGSSSDGDSSGSASSTGMAVTTAFVKSGAVIVRNETGEIWDGLVGTVVDSEIQIDIPDSVPVPFVVEVVPGSKLAVNGGLVDLQSPLNRVVLSRDELSHLYVTAFSTIKAEAYMEAARNGLDAAAISQSALDAVFDSLGLEIPGDIETIDPRTSPELEFAQQALFFVIDGVSDAGGLGNFQEKVQDLVVKPALSQGEGFTPASFIDALGKSPAPLIESNKQTIINSVAETFEGGASAGSTISGAVARKKAGDIKQPENMATQLVGFSVVTGSGPVAVPAAKLRIGVSEIWAHEPIQVKMQSMTNATIDNASFSVVADEGVLVAYADTRPADDSVGAWSRVYSGATALKTGGANKIFFRPDSDTATSGLKNVVLTSTEDAEITSTITVRLLSEDDVVVSAHADLIPSSSYLAFEKSGAEDIVTCIPGESEAPFTAFDAGYANPASSPTVLIGLNSYGNRTGEYDIYLYAPEDTWFLHANGTSTDHYMFTCKLEYPENNDDWEKNYWVLVDSPLDADINTLDHATIQINDVLKLKAGKELSLGKSEFTVKMTKRGQSEVLSRVTTPVYLLKKEAVDYITEVGPTTTAITSLTTDITPDSEGFSHKLLDAAIGVEADSLVTWKEKALGSQQSTQQAPDKAFILTTKYKDGVPAQLFYNTTSGGGTPDARDNMEILTASSLAANADLNWTPITDVSTELLIEAGEDADNFEQVILELWYTDVDGEIGNTKKIRSTKGVTFSYEAP